MQVWDSMELCENGRLCTLCNNVIFDFRGKTKWEIALKHAQSEQKVCGIYDKKVIIEKETFKQPNSRGLLFAGTLGLLATSSPAFSQNHKTPHKPELVAGINHNYYSDQSKHHNPAKDSADLNQLDSIYQVRGILTNKSGEPLPGGMVIVKGTENGAPTDIYGQFTIDVTEELEDSDSLTLVASYIGYGKKEKVIAKSEFNQKTILDIKIVMNEEVEYEVFSVGRPPLHRRIWYRIRNAFRKNE